MHMARSTLSWRVLAAVVAYVGLLSVAVAAAQLAPAQPNSTAAAANSTVAALSPWSPFNQSATNPADRDAISLLRTELFRNTPPAVQEVWDLAFDPCGAAYCRRCNWLGLMCDNGRIVSLELVANSSDPSAASPQLDAVLPGSTLALLTDLQTLRLSGHRLRGPLSPDLAHLKLLQVLDLSSNMLTGTLPKEWGDPATGGFPLLQTLDLSNNQLRGGLPQDWANLTSLTVLNMSDNANVCCQLVPAVAASRVLILDMTGTKALPCATDGSARPAKAPAASPPAGQPPGATGFQAASFNRSMGVNIAVSVIIGSCLVFGVVAGVVRVRRQQAEHQAWMQRRRRRLEAVRMLGRASGDANGDDLEGVGPEDSAFCSTPTVVLTPDGKGLYVARKLRLQSPLAEARGVGLLCDGAGSRLSSSTASSQSWDGAPQAATCTAGPAGIGAVAATVDSLPETAQHAADSVVEFTPGPRHTAVSGHHVVRPQHTRSDLGGVPSMGGRQLDARLRWLQQHLQLSSAANQAPPSSRDIEMGLASADSTAAAAGAVVSRPAGARSEGPSTAPDNIHPANARAAQHSHGTLHGPSLSDPLAFSPLTTAGTPAGGQRSAAQDSMVHAQPLSVRMGRQTRPFYIATVDLDASCGLATLPAAPHGQVTESSSSGALEPAPALADKDPAEEARAFKPSRWWFGRSPTPPPSHVAVQPNPSRDEHHSASDSPRPAAADARRRATARGAQGLIS